MIKTIVSAAALAVALGGTTAAAAAAAPSDALSPSWLVSPSDGGCRTDLELTGHSGAVAPVTLLSDGDRLVLRFSKDDIPAQAFLPIRIDQKPYSNLMMRTADPRVGELILSPETQAALRKGATLNIAWLTNEPVKGPLAGGWRGLPDLKSCGAQVAAQARARAAAESEAKAHAEAEARAKAVADAQLEAARAQQAAADEQRQRAAYEAQRQQAEADAARQQAAYAEQQQAALEAREQQDAQRQAYLRRYGSPYGGGYGSPYSGYPQAQPQPYGGYGQPYGERDDGW